MQSGLYYGEMSDFKKNLIHQISDLFPEETKKFLKTEGKKQLKIQKQVAKQKVGTKHNDDKSYHKKFNVTKVFEGEDKSKGIKVYNSSPHAHLIEYGQRRILQRLR